MRIATVYRNDKLVGTLSEHNNGKFEFRYDDTWFADPDAPSVSLTMPKTQQVYTSDFLFPFFYNMLSEGANRDLQCRLLRIERDDDFGLLLASAHTDTVGAITVRKIEIEND